MNGKFIVYQQQRYIHNYRDLKLMFRHTTYRVYTWGILLFPTETGSRDTTQDKSMYGNKSEINWQLNNNIILATMLQYQFRFKINIILFTIHIQLSHKSL